MNLRRPQRPPKLDDLWALPCRVGRVPVIMLA